MDICAEMDMNNLSTCYRETVRHGSSNPRSHLSVARTRFDYLTHFEINAILVNFTVDKIRRLMTKKRNKSVITPVNQGESKVPES
ncbi:hypothetical protein ACTXT7_010029 [Hymenolepis weldensis]